MYVDKECLLTETKLKAEISVGSSFPEEFTKSWISIL